MNLIEAEIAEILLELVDTLSGLKISDYNWRATRKAADSLGFDRWFMFDMIQKHLSSKDACDYIAANYSVKEICWEYCVKCNDESPIVNGACKVCGTEWVDNQEAVG